MRHFILFFLPFFFSFFIRSSVFAQSDSVNLYFFWSHGCPHCAQERAFLGKLEQKHPRIKVFDFEITEDKENIELFKKVAEGLNTRSFAVPFTVIGKKYFIGWLNEETTGKEIEAAVKCAVEQGCSDVVRGLITPKAPDSQVKKTNNVLETVKLPLFGDIKTKDLSLPILTLIIAFLDGFNPCAMWALIFLISLLLGMKNKKRMWILGTVFIATSAFVYFLFMSAWLNLFLFLGFVLWLRIVIGLIALGAGGYNLRDYFVNKESACKITGGKKRQKIFQKMKEIAQRQEFLFAIVGIILLAFVVNLVELVCSAGLPAIYTQVLALNRLPQWQYYLYLGLYILIFMLDDLFVFFAAMITLQATGLSTRYARYSHLIGGMAMVIIGVLMLVKPELLMFG